jgi:hypothetical protein
MLASAIVGIAAALSLLPYTPAVRAAGEWGVLVRSEADLGRLWIALQGTAAWDAWGWVLLAAAGLAPGITRLLSRAGRRPESEWERDRALYTTATLVCGIGVFIAFVIWTKLATQPWYYLPLLALVAASLDAIAGTVLRTSAARIAAGLVVAIVTASHLIGATAPLSERQTNLDLIAKTIHAKAGPRDLVVVYPWYYGVTLHRYYEGATPWMTLPPLGELSFHRYDLLMRSMRDSTAVDSVVRAMAGTLTNGGRVWLVGSLPAVEPGETPHAPPPAPSPEYGWNFGWYSEQWGKYMLGSLTGHLIAAKEVPIESPVPVSAYESPRLFELSGWR